MKKLTTVVLASFLAMSCQKKESEKRDLSLHLNKGFEQTLIYSTTTNGNSNGGMNDVTEVKYHVDSVDQLNNYYITGEITRMTFSQNMFGETVYFDSRDTENKQDDGMGEEIKPLINNPFTFTINKYGKILKKHQFKNEIPEFFSAKQYNIIPLAFPEEAVEIGHSWKENTTNPMTKMLPVTTDYTYRGEKNNKIEVSLLSRMSGMDGVLKETEVEGKYVFDSKTGTLFSAERKMPVQMGGGTATFEIMPKMQGFD